MNYLLDGLVSKPFTDKPFTVINRASTITVSASTGIRTYYDMILVTYHGWNVGSIATIHASLFPDLNGPIYGIV